MVNINDQHVRDGRSLKLHSDIRYKTHLTDLELLLFGKVIYAWKIISTISYITVTSSELHGASEHGATVYLTACLLVQANNK